MYFEVLVTLLFLLIAILGVVGMVLTRPKRGLPPSFSAKASDENTPERGSIFMAIFGAVAMVGILGSATFAFMNGPLRSSIFLTNRNIAATQMNVAAQMAVAAAAAQDNGGDCDGDDIIEPLPFRAKGTEEPEPPTGGGYIPSLIGTSKTDPWGRPYGYCVWDHGTEINDSGCGGASQNRRSGTASDGLATVAIISSGSDRAFQTTCNNFADTAPADGQPDVELVAKADGSDDLITLYTYVEAMGASSGLWQLKSGSANTATIGSKDIEVGGNASFSGQVITDSLNSRSGRLDVNDPLRLPDETAFPTCTAELVGAVRRYQGAIEICGVTPPSTYAFQPVGGGGATSIDELSDAITNYATDKYSIFLGQLAGQNNTTGYYNTALGYRALATNTTSNGSTALGTYALRNSTGSSNTAVGASALSSNTTSTDNTAVGREALTMNTTGAGNTAIGASALSSNTTSSSNTAVGRDALEKNTSGSTNTSVGTAALSRNTTGTGNTAIGASALTSNDTESGLTAVGTSALSNNNSGSQNTAVGYQALFRNTSGSYNTSFGYQALYNNTTGQSNTAFGDSALYSSYASYNNTAIGSGALSKNTTAYYNTAVGALSLSNNTTAYYNTAMGASSLASNTTGAQNTAVGYQALNKNITGSQNTALGYQALQGGATQFTGSSNTAVGHRALTNVQTTSAGNVAVGVSALWNNWGNANTAVGGQALYWNSTGQRNVGLGSNANYYQTGSYNIAIGADSMYGVYENLPTGPYNIGIGYRAIYSIQGSAASNTALGAEALYSTTTGGSNTAVGRGALYSITTGANNTALGNGADVTSGTITNSMALGYDAKVSGDNQIVLGNGDISAIYANVTSITAISDRRLKKDIGDLGLGLDFLRKLRPVEYKFNNGDDTLRYGFIAQEVETALPEALQRQVEMAAPEKGLALLSRQFNEDRTYRLSYGEMTAPLVKAVQEIAANDDRAAADIAALKREIAELRKARQKCTRRRGN